MIYCVELWQPSPFAPPPSTSSPAPNAGLLRSSALLTSAIDTARKERLRSSRPLDQELPQLRDPLSSLPNPCVYAILERFTAVELIGMRRVSCAWKDAVDWRLAGIVRKCRPELAEGSTDKEQATLEFRREAFRQQARSYGMPVFVRRFTQATQGFAMCGDYFCWIDNTWLNVQPVFKSSKTGRFSQVGRSNLKWLLGADSLSVETIKPQEGGSTTDRPLLVIKYVGEGHSARDESISPRQALATRPVFIHLLLHVGTFPFLFLLLGADGYRIAVICVKNRTVLWSTAAHDKPLHSSTPWGKLVTLNHTSLAYITQRQPRPTLYVRDVLTGEIKATKPIPDDLLPFPSSEEVSVQLHPYRDLVYIAVCDKVFFFSTTTANCVGRLSVARLFSENEQRCTDRPPRLLFNEHQPKCSPSAREKLFLCQHDIKASDILTYCFEYEVPTDEDISISEARILQNGDQGSEENSIFKVLRVQIYEHYPWGGRLGRPELNPMLKQSAHTEVGPVNGKGCTRIRLQSFTMHYPLPEGTYDIFLEPGKPYDGSIPAEFYPRCDMYALVTKPKRTPARVRRHDERVDFFILGMFTAPITLTERYMLLTHEDDVYFFAFEPRW